jgi:excisionase family DNA binding protein
MTKSDIFISLASLPDNDPKLAAVAAALNGQPRQQQAASFRMFRMGQAAKETGISRATLWRAVCDGRLKSVEIRKGSHRIPETELRRFVEGRPA